MKKFLALVAAVGLLASAGSAYAKGGGHNTCGSTWEKCEQRGKAAPKPIIKCNKKTGCSR